MGGLEQGLFPEDDFEVEVSAVQPGDREDASLAVWTLLEQRPTRKERARRLVFGGSLLLAALVILVAGVPPLRSQALRLFGGAGAPTPRAFSYAPLTPQPWLWEQWFRAGPEYASTIAFALSAPERAYTCGALEPAGNLAVPISLGVSHDAGATWQTLKTHAAGVGCFLTMNPTNAQDVVLATRRCSQCTTFSTTMLNRTFDGGKHWSDWGLPPIGPNQSADLQDMQWVWLGSTLFVAPYLVGDSAYRRLAVSVDGRPFVWLKTEGIFAGAPADASIAGLFATDTRLYVELQTGDCTTVCFWYMQSRDGGVSWSRFKPVFHNQPVYLRAVGGDERTLLGQAFLPPDSRIYLRSEDGGAVWDPLPSPPEGLVAGLMMVTPDGTVYAEFDQNFSGSQDGLSLGIYRLVPGAAAWHYAAPLPPGGWFTVAWNEYGYPVALWGLAVADNMARGLMVHQP